MVFKRGGIKDEKTTERNDSHRVWPREFILDFSFRPRINF